MKHNLFGVVVFTLLVTVLAQAKFVIEPTALQYAACVVWSAMAGWSSAAIAKRALEGPKPTRKQRSG